MFAILIYIFAVIGVFAFLAAAVAVGFSIYDWLSKEDLAQAGPLSFGAPIHKTYRPGE
jgi:hypothetical protein